MYKLLLVGGDKNVRNILSQDVMLTSVGIDELFEAHDGVDAIKIIEKKRPDIILTEINMPVIGGLELSLIIKKICGDIIVIFMGDYKECSFAKKMSNVVTFEHILKPINSEEIMSVIQRAVEDLNNDCNKSKVSNKMIMKTVISNSLFARLINSCEESESIYQLLSESKINIKFKNYFIVVFYFSEKYKEKYKKYRYEAELLYVGIIDIIKEICSDFVSDFFVSTYCEFNIVLTAENQKSDSQQVKDMLDKIKSVIKEFFNIDIVIGISGNYHSLDVIRDAYHEAYEKLIKQEYCGYSANPNTDQGEINEMFMEKKKKLIKSIYACDTAKAHKIIEWIYEMECKIGIPVKQIKVMNSLLLYGLVEIAKEIARDNNLSFCNCQSNYVLLSKMRSLENSKQFLIDISDELIASLTEKNLEIKNNLWNIIIVYINENFNKDITLHSIAAKFNIDDLVLSKMFKEKADETFSKYMVDFKIKKAEHLLLNTQIKVYEISNLVGYNDIKYFSKVFKTIEGVTPFEYRKIEKQQVNKNNDLNKNIIKDTTLDGDDL